MVFGDFLQEGAEFSPGAIEVEEEAGGFAEEGGVVAEEEGLGALELLLPQEELQSGAEEGDIGVVVVAGDALEGEAEEFIGQLGATGFFKGLGPLQGVLAAGVGEQADLVEELGLKLGLLQTVGHLGSDGKESTGEAGGDLAGGLAGSPGPGVHGLLMEDLGGELHTGAVLLLGGGPAAAELGGQAIGREMLGKAGEAEGGEMGIGSALGFGLQESDPGAGLGLAGLAL